jgi:DNA-binding MurR/RpiR family transcriptional regulator
VKFLWREFVNPDCISLQSYDFVRSKYLISANDIFVVFSHRGTKTFSIQLEIAKKAGATTVLVTGLGSPDNFTLLLLLLLLQTLESRLVLKRIVVHLQYHLHLR